MSSFGFWSNVGSHPSSSRARRNSRRQRGKPRAYGLVEGLEGRVLLSTYMVTNHLDSGPGSLRGDIQMSNASPGANTITFAVAGTITLTSGQLEISNDLTITGPGSASLTISGANQSRIFQIDSGVTSVLSGMTITQGRAPDGGPGTNGGSMVPNLDGGPGMSGGNGGAVYNLGSLTLSGDAVIDSFAGTGGHGGDGGTQQTIGRPIYGNGGVGGTGGNGGGVYSSGSLTVINSVIDGNTAGTGGLPGNSYSPVPTGMGGAGGGLYASGALIIVGSTISNNHGGSPGSVSIIGYPLGAPGDGGGVAVLAQSTIINSTFSGNTGFQGGGIYNTGELRLTDVTISGNFSAGGPYEGGGGLYAVAGDAVLNNTIVAGNLVRSIYNNSSYPDDIRGGVDTASAYNLVGDGDGMTGMAATAHNLVGTAANLIDPMLAALGNYGGPTQTMLPAFGSPVIDAGSNALAVGPDGQPLATDQRGLPRIAAPTGGAPIVDIGAVEVQPPPLNLPLVVTTTSDGYDPSYATMSLRQAIVIADLRDGPSTITFRAGLSGIISLNKNFGPLELTGTAGKIIIQGPGPALLSVTNIATDGTTLLQISAGVNAEVDGLRIAGGSGYNSPYPPTQILLNRGILTLDDCSLGGHVGTYTSGQVINRGTMIATNCTFDEYGTTSNSGTATLSNCTFKNNCQTFNRGTLTISNSALGQDDDTDNSGMLTLTGCTLTNNDELINEGRSTLLATNCAMTGMKGNPNTATGPTAGMVNVGTATFTDCTYSNSPMGFFNLGRLTLNNCTISGNSSSYGAGGGAIDNAAAGTIVLIGSTISGNARSSNVLGGPEIMGGGVYNLGTISLFNCMITGNTAAGSTSSDVTGGAMFNSGSVSLTNCTVSGNTATASGSPTNDATGGGIYNAGGHLLLNNTIVAGNQTIPAGALAGYPDDIDGSVDPTSAYNLIGDADNAAGFTAAQHNQIGTTAHTIVPLLGPLANNGGPTLTVALLPGSPAIDSGSNALAVGPDGNPLLADQRGYYRVFNGTVDIGAYEYGSSALLAGDADADGKVDFADLVLVARHYGMTNATWADGDFNNDGSVGFDDLVIVARNYGKSISLTSAAAATLSPAVVEQLPKHVRSHHRPTFPS